MPGPKLHKAFAMNCAARVGYDWRVFCRECGDGKRPKEIDAAERHSEAVRKATAHNKGTKI